MIYVVDDIQLMILDEGAPVRVKVRRDVRPGHCLQVRCGLESRRVRVLEVDRQGRAKVEVGGE